MDNHTQDKNAALNHTKTAPRIADRAVGRAVKKTPPAGRFLPALILLLAAILWPVAARAAFVFEINQVGPDVVVTGSGSFNLTYLTDEGPTTGGSAIASSLAAIGVSNVSDPLEVFGQVFGPDNWGTGDLALADSNIGDDVAINGSARVIFLPASYVSGNLLSNSMTFNNTDFMTLGIDPGTYVYTWGSGATADSLTVSVVPEPSTWALAALGGLLLFGLALRTAPGPSR